MINYVLQIVALVAYAVLLFLVIYIDVYRR